MAHWLDLFNGISMPVKVGWLVWFVWSLIQIEWYLRARTTAPVQPAERVVRTNLVGRKPPLPRPVVKAAAPRSHYASHRGGSPEFLAALGLDEPRRAAAPEQKLA